MRELKPSLANTVPRTLVCGFGFVCTLRVRKGRSTGTHWDCFAAPKSKKLFATPTQGNVRKHDQKKGPDMNS